MKVVYLYGSLPAYRKDFFRLLNVKLKQRGHSLKVLHGVRSKDESLQIEKDEGFETESFPIKKWYERGALQLISFPGMLSAFKREKPDVYVLQFHVAKLTYWRIFGFARKHHIPYITWDCNYQKPELGRREVNLRTRLVNKTDMDATVCLTYGSQLKNALIRIGKAESDIVIAQNTINIEKIIAERSSSCDNRLFDHPLHVLFVGLVKERKYLDSAIEAVASIINEGHNIYFDIVGGGSLFEKCNYLIAQLGMGDRIIMHGPKHGEDVKHFFEQSDLFLLPGTGGLAVNEAMAYSLPVISTEGDGTIIDLIDGNGYLLQKLGDVDEIKKAIISFINLTNEQKQAMAKRSKDIILQRASLDNMVNRHIDAIEMAYCKNRVLTR